jgi:hypothetical protein
MQRYTFYLYLEIALHVSGGTSIHHQERIQLYLQHLVFVTPLLLPAAVVRCRKRRKRRKISTHVAVNSSTKQISDICTVLYCFTFIL